jgi:hypothetical protein
MNKLKFWNIYLMMFESEILQVLPESFRPVGSVFGRSFNDEVDGLCCRPLDVERVRADGEELREHLLRQFRLLEQAERALLEALQRNPGRLPPRLQYVADRLRGPEQLLQYTVVVGEGEATLLLLLLLWLFRGG